MDFRDPDQARADRIDVLFVVDDSGSMEDKQNLLRRALPDMVTRLTQPRCVDGRGAPVAEQPTDAQATCPPGSTREFNAVQDMHIGVVTSSVGAAGDCMAGFGTPRGARLVPPPDGLGYDGHPFLAWDPEGVKQPPGLDDLERLNSGLSELLRIGGEGCPDEASLEAFYRFLIDPIPPAGVRRVSCGVGSGQQGGCVLASGIDEALLAERAAFLRPDSLLAIILLSDETDCSIAPRGDALRFVTNSEPMPRATSICRTAPDDLCCHSCAAAAPVGCPPASADDNCQRGPYTEEEDPLLLRCWDQKRRFGVDRSHPVSRYVRGLTEAIITDREGTRQVNPLYAKLHPDGAPMRDPSLVFFTAIVGVPWQDLVEDPADGDALRYLTGPALDERVWRRVVGDPTRNIPPDDPLMIESVRERRGTHPITGVALAPSTASERLANPINGHEMDLVAMLDAPFRTDLQYACIFPLPRTRNCEGSGSNCGCSEDAVVLRKPICQEADGTYGARQWAGKAFPGVRQLQVLSALPRNAIPASICARNVGDSERQDFGYRPALEAMMDRLRLGLN